MVALLPQQLKMVDIEVEPAMLGERQLKRGVSASSISRGEKIRKLREEGRLEEVIPLLYEVLEERKCEYGEMNSEVFKAMSSIARNLQTLGRNREAMPLFEAVLAGRKNILGPLHPFTLNTMNDLGLCYKQQGNLSKAEQLYTETLKGRREVHSEKHPKILTSMNNLAALLYAQGKLDEAVPLAREALEGRRDKLGDRHADTLKAAFNLGMMLHAVNELEEARLLLAEAHDGRKALLRAGNKATTLNDVLFNSFALATVIQAQGGDAAQKEAVNLVSTTVAECRASLGDTHPTTQRALSLLTIFLPDPTKGLNTEAEVGLNEDLSSSFASSIDIDDPSSTTKSPSKSATAKDAKEA